MLIKAEVKQQNAVSSQNFPFFADNIGLRSDFVRFKQILCFSKIEGSTIP